jgi:acetyl esterase/lipase
MNAETQPPSAIAAFDVEVEDFVWAKIGAHELMARSYRPKTGGRLRAVVDVHGGAWNAFDRTAGEVYDRALASSGLFVLAIDFRQAPAFQHPSGSCDVAGAVRWLRVNANELNVDPDTIGSLGSSSGGHLALVAGIRPDETEHRATPISQPDRSFDPSPNISASVAYVIALWPVSDPAFRYDYAKRVGRDELIKAHDNYFGSTDQMSAASVQRILDAKEATHLPPVLIVEPGKDANIPREMTQRLLESLQNFGGKVDYAFYPGQPHGFGHFPSTETDDLIQRMRDFIARNPQPA